MKKYNNNYGKAMKEIKYLHELFYCDAGKEHIVTTSPTFSDQDYKDIAKILFDQYEYIFREQSVKPARFLGCIVRLAGHDLMGFRRKEMIGGADGCINLQDPDNMGLPQCVVEFGILDIYNRVCHKIGLADFIVIIAEQIMGRSAEDYNKDDPWNPDTVLGRFKQ
jgi:hypothetical protein